MAQWEKALSNVNGGWKPFMQSLYVDLCNQQNAIATPIHLGFKAGTEYTIAHLKALESHRVNHVILNLKYGSRLASEVIEEIGEYVIPHFH